LSYPDSAARSHHRAHVLLPKNSIEKTVAYQKHHRHPTVAEFLDPFHAEVK